MIIFFNFSIYGQTENKEKSDKSYFSSELNDPVIKRLFAIDGPFKQFNQNDEVIEKRNESTKTFKNPDGSFTAVMTAGPSHYFENGVWKTSSNEVILLNNNSEYSIANINNQYKTYYGNIDKGIKVSLNKKIDLIKSYRTTEINIYDNAQQLKSNLIKYNNSNPKKVNTNEVEYNLANDITYNIKQLSDKIKSSIIINTNLFSNYNLYDYVGFEEEIELKANK